MPISELSLGAPEVTGMAARSDRQELSEGQYTKQSGAEAGLDSDLSTPFLALKP